MTDPSDYAPRHLRSIPADHPSPPEPAKPTWLQHIANAVAQLTYGEMKDFARGVLVTDDQAEVVSLADKFHEWALKTRD